MILDEGMVSDLLSGVQTSSGIIGEHLELLNRKVLNRIKNKRFCLHNLCVMVSRLDTDECLNNAVYLLIQQLWEQGKMVSMTFSSLTRE